jgi:amino acid adenylation domain-containing protein
MSPRHEQHACLLGLVEARAEQFPSALALTADSSSLTYAELDSRANYLSLRLRSLGVGPDSIVGLLLGRRPEAVVAMLGVLKAGAIYLPLDPEYPRAWLDFMAEDAGLQLVLTPAAAAAPPPGRARALSLGPGGEVDGEAPAGPPLPCHPEALAYVIYTSGSTGRPKGVGVPYRGLLNLVEWHRRFYRIAPDDRATLLAAPGFDASVWEVWPYLASGASLHVVPDEVRSAPAELVGWLARQAITYCFMPTPLAEAALAERWLAGAALKALLTGGDRLRRWAGDGRGFVLVNHYGPTECSVVTTCGVVGEAGASAGPPIGRPISGVRVYILDAGGEPTPVGVVGELYVGGEGVARGYLGQPDLTAERFVPDSFGATPGGRLYKTGDLARYLAGGEIEFLGRADRQVKVRGYRVELGEIEAALRGHEGVRECAAAAVEGEGGEARLAVFVVPHEGYTGGEQEWRAYLRERLPAHMVPSVFVRAEQLPALPGGKVDRRALAAAAGGAQSEAPGGYQAPSGQTQEALAGIWRELLGVERVGVNDSFFGLGGYSLQATQVVSRIRQAMAVEVPLRMIFDHPTIAELAEKIETLRWVARTTQDSPEGAGLPREVGEL